MKFTPKLVRELAADVSRFTEGHFKMLAPQPTLDGGTRYTDVHRDLEWVGGAGGRAACAYYIGAALGWAQATGTEMPGDIADHTWSVWNHLVPAERAYWEAEGREKVREILAALDLDEGAGK